MDVEELLNNPETLLHPEFLSNADLETWIAFITAWGLRLIGAILILMAGWIVGNHIKKRIRRFQRFDSTLESFLGGLAQYAIFTIAVITVLGQFGVQTASLVAVLGAAGIAVGLSIQGTLSNVAAGVMMLVLRPFNVGDFIEFGNTSGTVKSLGLFGTELSTAANVYVYAPNSAIWNSNILNYSRNRIRRQDLHIGISYDDDINKAFKVINDVLDADARILRTTGREPKIMVHNLGDFSVDLTVRIWASTGDFWDVKWDTTKAIKEALDKNGITIPFPTQLQLTPADAQQPPSETTPKSKNKKTAS